MNDSVYLSFFMVSAISFMVSTNVFHIISLEIYNLQSSFTVFVFSVKKEEQMSSSLRYN